MHRIELLAQVAEDLATMGRERHKEALVAEVFCVGGSASATPRPCAAPNTGSDTWMYDMA